jgi:hypothetical protein
VYLGGLASALGLGLALAAPGFWTVIAVLSPAVQRASAATRVTQVS